MKISIENSWIRNDGKGVFSHLPPSSVIVQIHQRPVVFVNLPSIDENPREVKSVLDVSAAAAPLPTVGRELPLQLVLVAAAAREIPRGARLSDGVGDAG